ncbi:hypothetical protein CKO36_10115 [Rhabdochromatium marinum]|nr:hypothetical protein [Rhabdochromatium marinum]
MAHPATARLTNARRWAKETETGIKRGRHFKKPTEPRGRMCFLSDQDCEALLKACREASNPWLYTAVVVALSIWGAQSRVDGLDLERCRSASVTD